MCEEDEELEILFNHVNWVEDRIDEIKDNNLYDYITNCIINNEYCDIDSYKELLEERN